MHILMNILMCNMYMMCIFIGFGFVTYLTQAVGNEIRQCHGPGQCATFAPVRFSGLTCPGKLISGSQL